jgi:hypothetical protein
MTCCSELRRRLIRDGCKREQVCLVPDGPFVPSSHIFECWMQTRSCDETTPSTVKAKWLKHCAPGASQAFCCPSSRDKSAVARSHRNLPAGP